ncbi:MAG: hypothetical protein Q8P90_04400 [bacterium]|nr:hypothetical protein [bacterium]
MSQDVNSQKEKKKHTLGWIFGVILLISTLGALSESVLAGICVLAAGLLILPPSRQWLEKKVNTTFSRPVLIVISFILLIIASVASLGSSNNDDSNVAKNNTPPTIAEEDAKVEVVVETIDTNVNNEIQPEAPKEVTMIDRLWIAFDNSIKNRSGYDIAWSDTSSAVTVTKVEDSFWDENDLVRKDYADLVQYGKEAFTIEGVNQVQVVYKTEFTDQYGKKDSEIAIEVWFNKDEFQKYEWDNLSFQPVWQQMESGSAYYYVHPGINKNLTKDKLYLEI